MDIVNYDKLLIKLKELETAVKVARKQLKANTFFGRESLHNYITQLNKEIDDCKHIIRYELLEDMPIRNNKTGCKFR